MFMTSQNKLFYWGSYEWYNTAIMLSLIVVILFFRPSNDGLKTDVLLMFQFPANNVDTIRKQADDILHQKLNSNESFLKIDTSSPYLGGKKHCLSSFLQLRVTLAITAAEKGFSCHHKWNHTSFQFLTYLKMNKPTRSTKEYLPLTQIKIVMKQEFHGNANVVSSWNYLS